MKKNHPISMTINCYSPLDGHFVQTEEIKIKDESMYKNILYLTESFPDFYEIEQEHWEE